MSTNRNRIMSRFQAGRHLVMGLILIALAFAVVRYQRFGTLELSSLTSYTLAAIMVFYGLFRVWRGIRELKNKDADDLVS